MLQQQFQHEYYCPQGIWDEMSDEKKIRGHYEKVFEALQHLNISDLQQKEKIAGELFMNQGITFTVYSDNEGIVSTSCVFCQILFTILFYLM